MTQPPEGTVEHIPPGGERRPPTGAFGDEPPWLAAGPRRVGALAWLLGVLSLADALISEDREFIHTVTQLLPVPVTAAAQGVVAVAGLLLLRLASGLRRGRRREWRLAVVATSALLVASALRESSRLAEAAICAALLVALVATRRSFGAVSDPVSRRVAARLAAQVLVFGVAFGSVLVWLPQHVPARTGWLAREKEVVFSLVGAGGTIDIGGPDFADAFHASVLAFGMLSLLLACVTILRPPEPAAVMNPEDERRLRALLHREGHRDSLGWFALRRDKLVAWSPSGKAAVAYRVVRGVALASGDPIGDPEAWPGAIREFGRLAARNGWVPAVVGCGEIGATVYGRELRLRPWELGDEAIVTVAEFSLDGRAMRSTRQACARVERAGHQIAVRRVAEIPAGEIEELRACAARWRADPVERGYSMALSRLGDPADGSCVVVTARRGHVLTGLLHFVPWGPDGLSLDLMRRDPSADNGLSEAMIATMLAGCRGAGVTRVSLNFAMFRELLERGAKTGAAPVARATRQVLLVASRWWQIDSLYRFNAKFRPHWQPRYIAYPAARDLPRIALASLEAESFVREPRLLLRLFGRS